MGDAKRILVVEDQRLLRVAIQDTLKLEGYEVITASDGVEALAVMEERCPDLIIADIMMPRMDGYAFYEAVRARPAWVAIPFIFLTAKAEREDILKGKGMGAEDYITKPFDPDELLVVVRARLGRARQIKMAAEAEFEDLKVRIATILGHELRTPLTYVLGYTDLALEDISSLSPEALQGFLLGIQRGAERLARLVEDLLTIVRIDMGHVEQEFRLTVEERRDLDEIVSRVARQYERLAAARRLALQVEIAPELPPLQLSEALFCNALGRLLDNAIKFSREKSSRIWVRVRPAGEWVEVAVTDEGVGIAAEAIPHLFQRFRQIDRDRMEQQGAGLGLAIAHAIIELHGGEITVDSEPGVGSTFTIRLPVASEDARSAE